MGTGAELIIGGLFFSAFMTAVRILAAIPTGADTSEPDYGPGMQANFTDGMANVPLQYGKLRVGINRVYMDVSGERNNDLHIIGLLSEGEVNQVVAVYADDKLHDDAAYKGLITYEFYTGTETQTVCSLNSVIPTWTNPMRYSCYIYAKMTYNKDVFQSVPNITVEFEGMKVYDPRTLTVAYSNNPALIVRDLLTRSSKRGGLGISESRIDDASFGAAATYCEAQGWTCDIRFNSDDFIVDNISKVLSTFRGDLIFSNNCFKLLYRDLDYESSVMEIDTTMVQCDESGNTSLNIEQPSIFETPNAVKVKYMSPEKKYQFDELIVPDSAALAIDGDYREEAVNLEGVANMTNAGKLGAYALARLRVNKNADFRGRLDCAQLEPCDLVRFTHNMPGWSRKLFRVAGVTISFDGEVNVSMIEESADIYTDAYSLANHVWRDTNLPDPTGEPISVINVSFEEEVYSYGNRTFTRLKINFDGPLAEDYPWWKHAEVWVSIGDQNNYRYMTASTSDYLIDPVQEGVMYYVKLVSVSIFDTKQSWDMAYTLSTNITGKGSAPSDPEFLTAMASGDTVTIITDDIDDPDVDYYEVRYGPTWDAGLLIARTRSGTIRLTGVKPGSYTFWLGVRDNRGRYNTNKLSASCTVFYPSGYTDKASWAWDFTTGTHDGTVRTFYNATSCLRVSHGNVVDDGGFESGVSQWSVQSAVIDQVAGGVSGYCARVTASAAYGYALQRKAVKEGRSLTLEFYVKATAGDSGFVAVYDEQHLNWLTSTSAYSNTAWGTKVTETFTVPAGCTSVRIALMCVALGDIMFFDGVALIDNANVLTGRWTSPVYDLTTAAARRFWGDFLTVIQSSNTTWEGVFGTTNPWNTIPNFTTKRWYEIFQPTTAAQLESNVYWGTALDGGGNIITPSTARWFHISAPEFLARYVQVDVTLTDPALDAYLYLQTLNMKAAYWQ